MICDSTSCYWIVFNRHIFSAGMGGPTTEHSEAREGAVGDQVKSHAPRLQPVLPRGEARVVVALYR